VHCAGISGDSATVASCSVLNMTTIFPWPCMVSGPVKPQPAVTTQNCSFAQALNDASDVTIGLADRKKNLHGRLVMNKGDRSLTARELSAKLSTLWKTANQWKMISLGRGFYEFQFVSFYDKPQTWGA
ncbi:DUF4283 domain protein, partial [Trifolium medium]|nr:DUF4283 domain protein [Trifolium medium]